MIVLGFQIVADIRPHCTHMITPISVMAAQDVVKAYEKITADVTDTSDFQKDLGLDSLDAVELVMAFGRAHVMCS